MTLLELLKTKVKMPQTVWDYRVYAPMSLNDEARITVHMIPREGMMRTVILDLVTGQVQDSEERREGWKTNVR